MTKQSVYLETSVVGYATSRPSRSLLVAGHQQVTRDWFARKAVLFDLYVSRLVVTEAAGGDEEAVQRRAAFLAPIPSLAVTDAAGQLAASLVDCKAVPRKAAEDALHIAVATVHGVDYPGTADTSPMRRCVKPLIERAGWLASSHQSSARLRS